jgi:hypothetical protein
MLLEAVESKPVENVTALIVLARFLFTAEQP